MKYLQLSIIAIMGFAFSSMAQQKTTGHAEIKTPEATCDICKDRIENYVSKQYGVLKVKVDPKRKTTTVDWLTDRTNIEEVKTAIANAGFDADDVTAEETAYKKLPRECKKPGTAMAVDSLKH